MGYQIFLRITRFVILVIRPDYQKFYLRSTPAYYIIRISKTIFKAFTFLRKMLHLDTLLNIFSISVLVATTFFASINQTCQLSRVTRESHGFLHFLQSHGRGNSCSRVYSCPTVLFSHRLLPIIIAGNTFWQHKFSVK